MKLDADSFLFTDDFSGVIYYVRKKGAKTAVNVQQTETEKAPIQAALTNLSEREMKNRICFPALAVLFVCSASAIKTCLFNKSAFDSAV
jgi:hypothetical protein